MNKWLPAVMEALAELAARKPDKKRSRLTSCCQCNGKNARCKSCSCVRKGQFCSNCSVAKNGHCSNPTSTRPSSHIAEPQVRVPSSVPTSIPVSIVNTASTWSPDSIICDNTMPGRTIPPRIYITARPYIPHTTDSIRIVILLGVSRERSYCS